MQKIAILSGAGISQESGISTFRDANGLWENHDIMEVASIQGWKKNPQLVLDFYNQRRRQLKEVEPNQAHKIIAELSNQYQVNIVTQNVDDLHERAGSDGIIHLHGKLYSIKSESNDSIEKEWREDVLLGDKASDGGQFRPNIVWFGEEVPEMTQAMGIIQECDILIVIGTSLQVYPAAQLINYADKAKKKYIIDPHCDEYMVPADFVKLQMKATDGMIKIKEELL